jgi:hypothetical protein
MGCLLKVVCGSRSDNRPYETLGPSLTSTAVEQATIVQSGSCPVEALTQAERFGWPPTGETRTISKSGSGRRRGARGRAGGGTARLRQPPFAGRGPPASAVRSWPSGGSCCSGGPGKVPRYSTPAHAGSLPARQMASTRAVSPRRIPAERSPHSASSAAPNPVRSSLALRYAASRPRPISSAKAVA